MKHKDLKQGDIVIFKIYSDIYKKEVCQDGSVILVDREAKKVHISWLEGYRSMTETVAYEKVIAKHDPNGVHMKFELYSGNSVLLEV